MEELERKMEEGIDVDTKKYKDIVDENTALKKKVEELVTARNH